MKKLAFRLALAAVLAAAPLLTACSDDDDDGAPSSHMIDAGGVMHLDGFADPLKNCTECHGATLNGGRGPSCYSCHTAAGHSITFQGVNHATGVDCTRCHGPNNTGGLGPACSTCHG